MGSLILHMLLVEIYGYLWKCMVTYAVGFKILWIFSCSVRFCDFKFNMATREGVSSATLQCCDRRMTTVAEGPQDENYRQNRAGKKHWQIEVQSSQGL